MKNISLFLLLLCFAFNANAATNITTSTVSGNWTLAGSPYLIHNSITIDTAQTLCIEPGVQVILQGHYMLTVNGMLYAVGTAALPISFTINDTSGFAAYPDSAAGSWLGIVYNYYTATATDTSALSYCNISYIKYTNVPVPFSTPIYIERNIGVKFCNIHDCSSAYANMQMISTQTAPGQTIEFTGCNFYNNNFNGMMIEVSNYGGGYTYIHNNSVYNNSATAGIFYCIQSNMLLDSNNIYQNTIRGTASAIGVITFSGPNHATVSNNSIHNNISNHDAAVACFGGFVNVTGNLICNNWHEENTGCGAVDGGGGINLSWDAGPSDSTFYYVANNIIANNYSPFHGGGISIFHAKATIVNNDILNNGSLEAGGIYIDNDSGETMVIKNNILSNNISTTLPSCDLFGFAIGSINYDHNWIQMPYYQDVSVLMAVMTGDSTTNIIGTTPGMIAPTTMCVDTENAVIANFGLLSTSACINKGDNTMVTSGEADYLGNARIFGGTVDIGAIEYGSFPELVNTFATFLTKTIQVYPNPASGYLLVKVPIVKGTINIKDITGKTILEQTVTNTLTSMDIHAISAGVYFVQWDDTHAIHGMQKVVIQ